MASTSSLSAACRISPATDCPSNTVTYVPIPWFGGLGGNL